MELHRFFIAISRVVVIMMILLEMPRILSCGLLVLFPRAVGWYMQCVIMLCCLAQLVLGPLIFVSLPPPADDVNARPCSVGILVKWVAFLSTLHWPVDGAASRCLFCMSFRLVKGSFLRMLSLGIVAWAPNFSVGYSSWSRH